MHLLEDFAGILGTYVMREYPFEARILSERRVGRIRHFMNKKVTTL
jgi:hypothetical protein